MAAQPVTAQEAPRIITLDEAIRIGLTQSPDLRSAELSDEAAGLGVRDALAEALPLPFISLGLQPTQRYGLAFDQTTGQLTSQTSEALNVGVSASVNLFSGFHDKRALAQARLQRRASAASLNRTRQQVAVDVASRFLQVLLDREIVLIRAENLVAQEALLEQVEALVNVGSRPPADQYTQQAVVAQAEGGTSPSPASRGAGRNAPRRSARPRSFSGLCLCGA